MRNTVISTKVIVPELVTLNVPYPNLPNARSWSSPPDSAMVRSPAVEPAAAAAAASAIDIAKACSRSAASSSCNANRIKEHQSPAMDHDISRPNFNSYNMCSETSTSMCTQQ